MFDGKIHYFDWAIFNSFLYVHQGVNWISLSIYRDVGHGIPLYRNRLFELIPSLQIGNKEHNFNTINHY